MIFGAALGMLLLQAGAAAPAAKPAPQPLTRTMVQTGVKDAFTKLDVNKDGVIDSKEAQIIMTNAISSRQKRRAAIIAQVDANFAKLDTNKDGSLSKAEYEASVPQVQTPTGNPWLTSNDTNKDGRVSLAELTAVQLREFDAVDKDKNGTISAAEARASRTRPASR